jgi:hypothetical protein
MQQLAGDKFLEALSRGREDHEFFGRVFLGYAPHPGQLDFLEHAQATLNLLPTSNRWGKTFLIPHLHIHDCIYKIGAEDRYLDELGEFDQQKFAKTKYHTIHTAGDWETTALVWNEAHKLISESVNLQAFVKDAPRSLPPHIDFITGSRWKFRTLGHDARGIDGNSFYIITVDEAGWIEGLESMTRNVLRVRVADVRGRIYYVGTMKPGISKDFYKYSVRAAARTGADVVLDHRSDQEEDVKEGGGIDSSIRKYCREFGVDYDEILAAVEEGRGYA